MYFLHSTKGLNNIHALTSHPNSDQVLRIELTTLKDETIIVQYGKFKVGPKKDGYRLTIGDYTSPNGKYRRFYPASCTLLSRRLQRCVSRWVLELLKDALHMRLETNFRNLNFYSACDGQHHTGFFMIVCVNSRKFSVNRVFHSDGLRERGGG